MRRVDTRGDTIVEVLVVLAVMGMVLGVSYATATRGLQGGRRSQERAEALKVAETQLEQLKYLAAIPDPASDQDIFRDDGRVFCVSTTSHKRVDSFAGGFNFDNTSGPISGYPDPECIDKKIPGGYNYAIRYNESDDLFTVRVRWDRLGGGQEDVTMVYRLYQSEASSVLPASSSGAAGYIAQFVEGGSNSGGSGGGGGGGGSGSSGSGGGGNPSPPPTLWWWRRFTNTTPDQGAVTGCLWDWNDGTTTSNQACDYGNVLSHTFPTTNPVVCSTYNVRLTIYFQNGNAPVSTRQVKMPGGPDSPC